MRLLAPFITLLFLLTAAACVTQPPRFRAEAVVRLEKLKLDGGERLRPAEYASTLQAFLKGDALMLGKEREEAGRYFELAILKAELLERSLRSDEERARTQAQRLAEERKRAELERQARDKSERLERARLEARARAEAALEAAEAERRKARPQKEPQPVNSYTVRRGESLPLIASHPQVYADRSLWPLIYRANRDQIRDPRHIWPGQVLRVPRNMGRDDISEARRYAQERPL